LKPDSLFKGGPCDIFRDNWCSPADFGSIPKGMLGGCRLVVPGTDLYTIYSWFLTSSGEVGEDTPSNTVSICTHLHHFKNSGKIDG